jgi:hypothetical protein
MDIPLVILVQIKEAAIVAQLGAFIFDLISRKDTTALCNPIAQETARIHLTGDFFQAAVGWIRSVVIGG